MEQGGERMEQEGERMEREGERMEREEENVTDTMLFKDTANPTVFNREFIRSHFCPLKFSQTDLKNLSSDFEDQTLGGHRKYTEQLIDGKIAKVYEYTVKIIKFEGEYLNVTRTSANRLCIPSITVENSLIVPYDRSVVRNKKIQLEPSREPDISIQTGMKRGRPRKYPVGKEPYKKRGGQDEPFKRPATAQPLFSDLFSFDSECTSSNYEDEIYNQFDDYMKSRAQDFKSYSHWDRE